MKDISIRLLSSEGDKNQFFALRHRVFTLEKQWVNSINFEKDEFDQNARFLGVFFHDYLVAATRIIYHDQPWMFDSVFAHLLCSPIEKEPQSVELTRYFVHPDYRKLQRVNGHRIRFSQILQQAFFSYAVLNNLRRAYCVFEYKVFWLFKYQNMPVENLNEGIEINEDMTTAIPVVMRYENLDQVAFMKGGLSDFANIGLLRN